MAEGFWACPRPSAMRALPSSRGSHIPRPRGHRQGGGRSQSPPRPVAIPGIPKGPFAGINEAYAPKALPCPVPARPCVNISLRPCSSNSPCWRRSPGGKILIGAKSPASPANAKGQERSPGLGQYREASAAPVERPSASRRPFSAAAKARGRSSAIPGAGRGQGHRQRRPEERGRRPRADERPVPSTGLKGGSGGSGAALSRCHAKSARGLRLTDFQAAATASRHVVIAAARSTRCD